MKAKLAAIAALVIGGLSLTLALQQEAPSGSQDDRALRNYLGNQPTVQWFAAMPAGYQPPEVAAGDLLIGDCAGAVCKVGDLFEYKRRASAAREGIIMWRFLGPQDFKDAWLELGAQDASVSYAAEWGDIEAMCLGLLPQAACDAVLDSLTKCWKRADGFYCRNGLLYGPGLGGVDSDGNAVLCAPLATDEPYPCSDGLE
jgi:hypothetical protein